MHTMIGNVGKWLSKPTPWTLETPRSRLTLWLIRSHRSRDKVLVFTYGRSSRPTRLPFGKPTRVIVELELSPEKTRNGLSVGSLQLSVNVYKDFPMVGRQAKLTLTDIGNSATPFV